MVIGGLVTAAAIAFGLSRTPLFDLERVDVVGVDESIQLMIVDASGLTLGDPLLDLDTTAAREGVESLPWVEVAQVSRNWPEAVTIAVRTRSPIAVLPLGDGTGVMVDRSGVGITTTPSIDTVSVPMVSVLACLLYTSPSPRDS